MDRQEFIAKKLGNFSNFLYQCVEDAYNRGQIAEINASCLKRDISMLTGSQDLFVAYFRQLAQNDIDNSEYMKTVKKYIDISHFKFDQVCRFEKYISMFLDICS